MTFKKKTWPDLFAAVANGKKKFDVRLNDVEMHEGDTLVLEEWNPQAQAYTGRRLEKRVTFVYRFKTSELFWPKDEIDQKGLQVVSLE